MAKAKRVSEAEKFGKELAAILKKRLTELEAKELIEMGFYSTQGIILFFALGEVVHSNATTGRKDWQADHMTEYFLQLIRGNMVELFNGIRNIGHVEIPGTGIKPLLPIGYMSEPFYYIMDIHEWKEIDFMGKMMYVQHWKAVPMAIRALLSVAIPSLEYIIIEFMKGTIEVG